jgi:hypothetical protein
LYDGVTSLLQTKHLHFQGLDAPGKSISGINFAFFINFTASSECTAFPEQNAHFTPLLLTLFKLGETSLLHLMHLDFQGVAEDSYGTSGENPEVFIILRASFSVILFATRLLCSQPLTFH